MITLNNVELLTENVIRRIVDQHKTSELPRLITLENYYNAKNNILHRQMSDSTKPNNKISNPYASYITDTLTGYFIGEPITYNSISNPDTLEELNLIFEYNDEADENAELAKSASIYGVSYEMLYMTEDGVRFKVINTKEGIPVYDDTIENELIAFIRYYEIYNVVEDKTYTNIEVMDRARVRVYQQSSAGGQMVLINEYPHYFGLVPIAIYKNNEDETGDFENVITLIDAYDKMESDTLNDQEYFTDAYLALYGFTADDEDIRNMKENRVLLMDEGTKAEWLIKTGNDTISENIKNRLDADIHKFSKCPNLADKEFASNASGIAIKFKTLGTENIVALKERKFKRGLQRRLELLANINGVLSSGFDWRAIDIIFTRNLPTNEVDLANMVNTLSGIVSEETLLTQLPFVDNIQDEIQRLDAEREKKKMNNPFLQNSLDYETTAMDKDEEEEDPDKN